ncbi:MAG: hypothetical protein MAGBODY4_01602 [Candidatus Marinimicrobia bacterium]|nr:hypothetical protein [Candidatus Neomarinimicrobiota bacterium]
MRNFISVLTIIGALFILFNETTALPRFAAQEGVLCGQCHVNDQGAALRNSYGAEYYSQKVLPMSEWDDFGSEDYTAQLNEYIRYGGDVRVQYYRYAEENSSRSAFFPMQADAYINVQPSEYLQFFLEQSLFRNFAATDVWAQYNFSKDAGYLRFGQFLPSYGLRLDDHTAFIRGGNIGGITIPDSISDISVSRQGLHWNPTNQAMGLEGMVKPFDLQLTGSVVKPSNSSTYSATLNLTHAFWLGDMNFIIGGSYFRGNLISADSTYSYYGVNAGLNFGRFTYLGEIDFTQNYSEDYLGQLTNGLAIYSELSVRVLRGCDLVMSYHFFDPSTEFTGRGLTRWTFGASVIPVAYIEIKPQYRILTAAADTDFSHSELIFQGHFWF